MLARHEYFFPIYVNLAFFMILIMFFCSSVRTGMPPKHDSIKELSEIQCKLTSGELGSDVIQNYLNWCIFQH